MASSKSFGRRKTPSSSLPLPLLLPSSTLSSSKRTTGNNNTSNNNSHNYYRLQGLFLGIFIGLFGQTIIRSTTTHGSSNSSSSNGQHQQQQHQDQDQKEKDFLQIATPTGTDKVAGHKYKSDCLLNRTSCTYPTNERQECRPWGHYYDTIYQKYVGKYSLPFSKQIQFLEIGYFQGKGFNAYTNYLDTHHELHSIEISCLEKGLQSEGKWPWGNFAEINPRYTTLKDQENRLHCGDASHYQTLKRIWDNDMKRTSTSTQTSTTTTSNNINDNDNVNESNITPSSSPPLMVVVDDGSHVANQMTISLFFWLPRLEPGGILIMEDIQPSGEANPFRTHILPQVIKDLHWCGGNDLKDTRCFPQLQPFLEGVHCEMHICVFIRNNKPSHEPNEVDSMMPIDAMSNAQKCLFGPH